MTVPVLLIAAGLLLLMLGGEALVTGAQRIARILGVPPLVIGLTVVAYGTSAPELGTSLLAGLRGHAEIAMSNVVGSNIFNSCMVLGVCALVLPLDVHLRVVRLDGPILVGVSLLAWLLCSDGRLVPAEGLLLLAGGVVYTCWVVLTSRREGSGAAIAEPDPPPPEQDGQEALWCPSAIVALGLGLLTVGSYCLVEGAVEAARILDVSESLVALTVVAAGTSLPELATSVMATLRRQTDIAVGNVVGSNLFNLLLVLGLPAGTGDGLAVGPDLLKVDVPVMAIAACVTLPLLATSRRLERWEGVLILSGYLVYVTFLLQRG